MSFVTLNNRFVPTFASFVKFFIKPYAHFGVSSIKKMVYPTVDSFLLCIPKKKGLPENSGTTSQTDVEKSTNESHAKA
jgi:hypothetical protein